MCVVRYQRPGLAVVGRGYRVHDEGKTRVLVSSTRTGLTAKKITDLCRRSAFAAEIDHIKTDSRPSRCNVTGTTCDAMLACGHNIRKILAHLRYWLA